MKKMLWTLAATAALVPAVIGLRANPTLGQSVPVQVPSSGQVVRGTPTPSPTGDDHGGTRSRGHDDPTADDHGDDRSDDPTGTRTRGHDDPTGNDHGDDRSDDRSDDHTGTHTRGHDDH